MQNLNIKYQDTDGTQNDIIVREGDAAKLIEPVPYTITGDIKSPANWLETKKDDIDLTKAYILVDVASWQINLHLNVDQENGRYKSAVIGMIEPDDKLNEFKINIRTPKWELSDLARHLKFRRNCFASIDQSMEIVSALKTFKANVSRQIEKIQDDRGNHRKLDDKRISSEVPEVFTLNMPVFKGDVPYTFDVELCIEEKEGVVRAFLQSVSLEEIIEKRIQEIIDREVKRIPEGVTIIYA